MSAFPNTDALSVPDWLFAGDGESLPDAPPPLIDAAPASDAGDDSGGVAAGALETIRARENDHYVSTTRHSLARRWFGELDERLGRATTRVAAPDDSPGWATDVVRDLRERIGEDTDGWLERAPSRQARARLRDVLGDTADAVMAEAARGSHRLAIAAMRSRLDRHLGDLSDQVVENPDGLDAAIADARALLDANPTLLGERERGATLRGFARDTAGAAMDRLIETDPTRAVRELDRPAWRKRLGENRDDIVDRAVLASGTTTRLDRAAERQSLLLDLGRVRDGAAPTLDVGAWVAAARDGGDPDETARREDLAERVQASLDAATAGRRRYEALRFASADDRDEALGLVAEPGSRPTGLPAWHPDDEDATDAELKRLGDPARHLGLLLAEQGKRLDRDPAGEAFEHPAIARGLRSLAAMDGDERAGQLGVLIARGQALQECLDVDPTRRRLLPASMAASLARALDAGPIGAIDGLRDLAGRDHAASLFGALTREGLAPDAAIVAALGAEPSTRARAERLHEALAAARADPPALSPSERERVDAAAIEAFAATPLARALREDDDGDPHRQRLHAGFEDATILLARHLDASRPRTAAVEAARLIGNDADPETMRFAGLDIEAKGGFDDEPPGRGPDERSQAAVPEPGAPVPAPDAPTPASAAGERPPDPVAQPTPPPDNRDGPERSVTRLTDIDPAGMDPATYDKVMRGNNLDPGYMRRLWESRPRNPDGTHRLETSAEFVERAFRQALTWIGEATPEDLPAIGRALSALTGWDGQLVRILRDLARDIADPTTTETRREEIRGVVEALAGSPGYIGRLATLMTRVNVGEALRGQPGIVRVNGGRSGPAKPPDKPPVATGQLPWQQTQRDVAKLYGPDARQQVIFKGKVEITKSERGATIIDTFVSTLKLAVEAKRRNLQTASSQAVYDTAKQARMRVDNLPPGVTQKVVLDVTGQSIPVERQIVLRERIVAKSNGALLPENVEFREFRK